MSLFAAAGQTLMTADTERTLARLRALLAQGKTLAQAGEKIGRKKSFVHKFAVRHRITRRRRKELSPRTDAAIRRRLREARHTLRRIAALCGVSVKSVWLRSRQELDRAGEFRPRGIRVARRCPRHGLVKLWPCVACAAEAARGTGNGQRVAPDS